MGSRIEWNRIKPATLRTALIELVVALALIATGWLALPTLLLASLAEPLVTVALSWRIHPQRSRRRHLLDVVKITVLLVFLGGVILLATVPQAVSQRAPGSRRVNCSARCCWW